MKPKLVNLSLDFLTADELAQLDAAAKEDGITRDEFVAQAIAEWIKKHRDN